MNRKIWFGAFLLSSHLAAASLPLHIYTLQAQATPDTITARKRVVVEYKDYYIQADRVQYDQKKGIIRLFGHIFIVAGKKYSSWSQSALLDLRTDKLLSSPFFFNESSSKLWVAGTKLKAKRKKVELQHSFISSCSVECPDWRFFFDRAVLDQQKHWIDLYHMRVYIKDTPLFYFPYIGFSTFKERQTGLLRPKIGISDNEGLIYIQPFFYAPTNWWDLELDPQIRTQRGYGLFGTFRFVDSPNSSGFLTTGFFKERKSYLANKKLKNDKHYGLELFYKRRGLFFDRDGIYVDSKNYNDVDYFNLQKSEEVEGLESIVTSRYNYFVNFGGDYFGLYARYFKDNRKEDNSDTLQLLPSLHYHRYTRSFLNNHFSYDIDVRVNHFYRKRGLNALEYQLSLPIRFHTMLLDDFLGFCVSEKLFANYADYNFVNKHLNKHWDNEYLYKNTHELSLYTDLVKGYQNFFHTLHLDATLNIPSFEKKGGDRAPFINIEDNSKKLTLTLKEYFYNDKGQEIFYHRLTQPIFYEANQKWRDLENELGFRIDPHWLFNSDIFYSHQRDEITSIVTTAAYKNQRYNLFLSHFYKNRVQGEQDSNFLRLHVSENLSKTYKLFATIDYDFLRDRTRNWSIGWQMRKSCWSYEISFKKETIPLLTSEGSNSYQDNTLYFRVELYPLGGISQSIRKTQERRIF